MIARNLNRTTSTVSREIYRNGGLSKYRTVAADKRVCKLNDNIRLCTIVSDKLTGKWTPDPVVGWLKQTGPEASTMHISHETLYKVMFIQLHSALKKELLRHLRAQRVMRQSRHFNTKAMPGAALLMRYPSTIGRKR